MKKIEDEKLKNMLSENEVEEIVVFGEGCLNDCPHRHSWTSSTIGCGTTYDGYN